MRNERFWLPALLLTAAGAAQAEPGSWFPPSPCDPRAPVVVTPAGARAILRVHDQPEQPPHDAALRRGEDGRWRVSLEEWAQWTSQPPPSVEMAEDGVRRVPLDASAVFAFRLDACTAEIWIDADPGRLQQLHLTGAGARPPLASAGHGGFLNLDAEYGGLQGRGAASALFDLSVFLPGGAGRSGFFADRHARRRLDSDWFHDDADRALRLRLGDSITHSPDWETAVRFGGVQWGTDFSLQPDRITFPLPSISGSAALTSTAQIYVNGRQLSQQTVEPGQFRLDSVPVLTGAGELTVVVRDALGREHTVTQPFYASPRLLAAGLDAYTAEGGFLRENYAQSGDRYTRPFTAAFLQHGFDDAFTGLVRVVAGGRRQQAGVEADWIAGRLGVVTLSGAGAHAETGWGGTGTAAFEHVGESFTLSLRRRYGTRAYGDLGRDPGTLHLSDGARLSYNAWAGGTASLVYVNEQPWSGSGVRLTGLAYSIQPWRNVQAYASWLHPLQGGNGENVYVGLSISLRRGTSGGVQWGRDSDSSGPRAFVLHAPEGPLGWSYSAAADARSGGVRQAQATWATARGTVGAGWAGFGGQSSPSALLQTGVALLDGQAYWTRPVQNSFAVVDAGSVQGVRVYRENQLVGLTNTQGRLLVPDLLPYQANRLTIDDSDLPISLGLTSTLATMVAPAGSGIPVHFNVDALAAVRLRLVSAEGTPVPAGAMLLVDGETLPLRTGYDGLVYARIDDGPHLLQARWDGGQCQAYLRISGGVAEVQACSGDAP